MTLRLLFIITVLFCQQIIAQDGSNIRIVQISDVQLGFTEARARETGKSVETGVDEAYYSKAIEIINNLQPRADLVVNTGDLVNDPNNGALWNSYTALSQRLKPRLFEVMGNHDGWSLQGVREFTKRFHQDDFYTFKVKNCRFIVLNSWYLKDSEENISSAKKQKHFLENTLRKDHSAFRVIMLHFPAFIESPDENDDYFNIPGKERQWLLDLALKYKVKLILSGHSHRNIINTYKDSVTLITTGPISEPLGLNGDKTLSQRGFRIIDINTSKGTFTHQFVTLGNQDVKKEDKGFSFVFLGDLHFDKPGHHDMQWVLKAHPHDTSQIRHYCNITKLYMPDLYGDIRKISRNEASFIVQSGDFTEGLCGSYALAERQMNEFVYFTQNNFHIPFLISKGNHDITGPGADSAYSKVILPFLTRQAGFPITGSKYVYVKDQSVFFFYDSYDKTSLNWLSEQMKKYSTVQNKFVIMHEPVIPINARSKWTELSGKQEKKEHEALIELLGDHKAIVIAGHLHAYALVVRKTSHGQFVQLSGSSVIDDPRQKPDQIINGINAYGPSLTDLEPDFSPSDSEERKAILSEERPFIKYYEYADLQGYIVVHVKPNNISADLYTGTGLNKWKTIDISAALKN